MTSRLSDEPMIIVRTYKLHDLFPQEHLKFLRETHVPYYSTDRIDEIGENEVQITYSRRVFRCHRDGCKNTLPFASWRYCDKHDPVLDLIS